MTVPPLSFLSPTPSHSLERKTMTTTTTTTTTTSPTTATQVPAGLRTLPPEITRRIIAHALSLPPAHLFIQPGEAPTTAWDEASGYGHAAHRAVVRRVKMRQAVCQDAKSLMRVCKAWKVLATKYLYAEPHIGVNLTPLAASIISGDRKWSDLNLHPISLPGRYITTLDLSHLDASIFGTHITSIARACGAIVPLLPNVEHLRLPPPRRGAGPVSLEQVRDAPFVRNLRTLEGVVDGREDGYGNGRKVLLQVLKKARRLEVLAVVGSAVGVDEDEDEAEAGGSGSGQGETRKEEDLLDLPRLHTLVLEDVFPGLLTRILINSDLPSLRRLAISPIHDTFDPTNDVDDGTASISSLTGTTYEALQSAHGEKILSLTYLHCNTTWCVPSASTLELHPNLVHLHLALLNSTLQSYDWFPVALRDPDARRAQARAAAREVGNGLQIPNGQSGRPQTLSTATSTASIATLSQRHTPLHKHPLHTISIPKWEHPSRQSPSPNPLHGGHAPNPTPQTQTQPPAQPHLHSHPHLHPHSQSHPSQSPHSQEQRHPIPPTPGGNKFLDSLLVAPPPCLRVITVQGFAWVRPGLPLAAMNTGESGIMRAWSARLALDGIELRDAEGRTAPEVGSEERERGRAKGGGARRRSGDAGLGYGYRTGGVAGAGGVGGVGGVGVGNASGRSVRGQMGEDIGEVEG